MPTFNVIGPSAYLLGDVIEVSGDFSKVVYVTGSPTLRLQIGDEERQAEYAGGSGTNTLQFQYTVGKWDRDDNGLSIPANPVEVSGHPIRDGDGNDAMLDHAGLGDQAGHVNWWAEFANRTFTGPTFLSLRDAWFAAHHGAVPPSSR